MGNMIPNLLAKLIPQLTPNTMKMISPYCKSNMKMVFLVRTDLNMGKGKIASQVAHATILLYKSSLKNKNPCLDPWLRRGQPKMVLKASKDCENTLNNVYQDALKHSLNACKVYDAGMTQVNSGTLTVVGIGPNVREEVDKITGAFKLL